MSTTMLNHNRRFLTPSKRKGREGFDSLQPLSTTRIVDTKPSGSRSGSPKSSDPACNNQLLAGFMAHEFLTKGTLLGQPWDPARAEAVPVSADSRKIKGPRTGSEKAKTETRVEKNNRYVEAADLLKTNGIHLPDVVNPTQLARFLQL